MTFHEIGDESSTNTNHAVRRATTIFVQGRPEFVGLSDNHFYVDDGVASFESTEVAQCFPANIKDILLKGRFILTESFSDHMKALRGIDPQHQVSKCLICLWNLNIWNSHMDCCGT